MAFKRPYSPFQYTPEYYRPKLKYDLPPLEDYTKQFTPSTPEEAPFDYVKEYEKIAGKRTQRLAYQDALKAGPEYIERGKLAKVQAALAAAGTALGTGDPVAGAALGTSVYQAPNVRARERWKERVAGLGESAKFEGEEISERLRALEANREDWYRQQSLGLQKSADKRAEAAEGRAGRAETRDIAADELALQEAKIRMDLLGVRNWTNKSTGIMYEMDRKGNVKAVQKVQPSEAEDVAMELFKEKEKEAILQPGRMELERERGQNRLDVVDRKTQNAAAAARMKLATDIAKPDATEDIKQQMAGLQRALINSPHLANYIKDSPTGIGFIPKDASDFYPWNPMDDEDKLYIAEVTAAMMAGQKPSAASPVPYYNKDKSEIVHISKESIPYWTAPERGYTPAPPDSKPGPVKQGGTSSAPAGNTSAPPNADTDAGTVKVKWIQGPGAGQVQDVPKADLPALLQQKMVELVPTAAPTSTTTNTIPPAAPAINPMNVSEATVEEGATLPFGGPPQAFPRLNPTTPIPRPVNNPFANITGEDITTQPVEIGRPFANTIPIQNRFGPQDVFGAGMQIPQQAPVQPPINLMPSPAQVPPAAPRVQQMSQRSPVFNQPEPINPILLGEAPPVIPQQTSPSAEITDVSGVEFGPRPKPVKAPFGRANQYSSELTNPVTLSKGFMGGAKTPSDEFVFNQKFDKLRERFRKETGYDLRVIRGRQTAEDQAKIYAIGRTAGDKRPVRTQRSGKPGDESVHQSGAAADVVFTKNGRTIKTWDDTAHGAPTKDGSILYGKLGKIAREIGLEWGGDWDKEQGGPDWGHVQIPERNKDRK